MDEGREGTGLDFQATHVTVYNCVFKTALGPEPSSTPTCRFTSLSLSGLNNSSHLLSTSYVLATELNPSPASSYLISVSILSQ